MMGPGSGEGYDLDDFAASAPTLRDHVAEQIAFTFADPAERLIATDIADQLDAAGYIVGDLAETVERLSIRIRPSWNMCWAASGIRAGRSVCPVAFRMPCVATGPQEPPRSGHGRAGQQSRAARAPRFCRR
jgi:hypothetical protein